MIVRKPYAFLIKYFKIIHIILFLFMTYLLFKVRALYIFFRDFLKTGTYTYVTNMVSKYINIPMIIFSILLVGFLLLIFFLMRQKKKPIFYYLSSTIFYFVTFVSFLFFISVFNNLEYQTYSNQSLVLFRDLTMVLYYLNYLFLAVAFVRGFGFNIKKFNFEKDIKELDITEADREEIEVGVLVDVDKVSNFFRRSKRNFGYYFKENSFILIVFGVIIVLSLTAYFTLNNLVFNKKFQEKDILSLNNINYVINASYLTNKDKYGDFIKNKDTYYLIIDFNVQNLNSKASKLEIENWRVRVGKQYYYPKSNLTSKFADLGTVYKKQAIAVNDNNNYILVFEIADINVLKEKPTLEIYNYKKVVNGEAVLYYKDVNLNPYQFQKQELGKYKLTSKVDLRTSYLKEGTFSVNNYEILDVVNYKYTKCDNKSEDGTCHDYNASVVPSASKKILKVEYTSNNINDNLFGYLNISYESGNNEVTLSSSNIKDITPVNYPTKGVVLLEVSNELTENMQLKLIFDLWGGKFVYE